MRRQKAAQRYCFFTKYTNFYYIKRQNINILLSIVNKIYATTRDFKHLCRQTKKSSREKRFLCVMCVMYSRFMDQNSADEGGKLFIGLGVGELCSPAVVELHIARMGGVADDELRIAAGLFPFEALGLLARG